MPVLKPLGFIEFDFYEIFIDDLVSGSVFPNIILMFLPFIKI